MAPSRARRSIIARGRFVGLPLRYRRCTIGATLALGTRADGVSESFRKDGSTFHGAGQLEPPRAGRRAMKRAVLLAAALAAASAARAADFSGVWRSTTQPVRLLDAAGNAPPLLPAAQTVYETNIARKARGDLGFDDSVKCKPIGEPRAMTELGWPFQIFQMPDRLTLAYQWNHLVRVVPIKAKAAVVKKDYAGPFFFGESQGWWEGDTLVVDVIGIRGEVLLDSSGLPHSEDMRLTERFRLLPGGKRLEIRIRIDDAKTFARPWETVLTFDRAPDDAIVEDQCLDRQGLQKLERIYLPIPGSVPAQ